MNSYDAESFADPSPALWRPPTGSWRPPTGTWPPPPPPFPRPPDFFSWFFWLNQNYEDAKQAKEFFKRILADLLADDPALLASSQATVGVTDGSSAQPGMVGEVVQLSTQVSFDGSGATQVAALGALAPGDWDCWAYAVFSVVINGCSFSLNPQPAGFSNPMLGMQTPLGVGEIVEINSQIAYARTTVPSLIAFQSSVLAIAPGNMDLFFVARRRR